MELPAGVRREHIEPLWNRVDRNRAKFAFFILAYLVSIAASAALLAAIAALLFGLLLVRSPVAMVAYYSFAGNMVRAVAVAALVIGSAWVAYAMLRSEKRLLAHLGAVLTPTGEYQETKFALKDMAIASGFEHAPPLWVIADCARVNAFAIGRTHQTAVIGVTQGFVDALPADEQRAVFANLMTRLRNGDVRWATAVSALVGPIWRLRDADLRRGDEGPMGVEPSAVAGATWGYTGDRGAGGALIYFVLYAFLIVITEVLLIGHQRSTMLTAEKADAEGMLLLKDPRSMLRALEGVLEADNTVPRAGETYSNLFYCWAGFGYAPEDDPEFRRVARLREVLGVEGLVDSPRVAVPDNANDLVGPAAPRIDDAAHE
jgi:Zn-dependent protease with chaperone function